MAMSETPPEESKMEEPKMGKPARSWRSLLTELAIVVLGVGLALAAQQAAEWWRWRADVAEAREFIATEMAENLVSAISRVRAAPCVERRLDTLARILDDAARDGRGLPPVGDIGTPVRRLWRYGIWESVVASQTATHFPRQELSALGSLYKFIQRAEIYGQDELEAWSDLSAMAGPGRRLDPASEAELRRAMGRARTANRILTSISSIVMVQAKPLNLPFGPNEQKLVDNAVHVSLASAPATATNPSPMSVICGPIGPVAPSYGQGTLGTVPGFLEDGIRGLEAFAKGLRPAGR